MRRYTQHTSFAFRHFNLRIFRFARSETDANKFRTHKKMNSLFFAVDWSVARLFGFAVFLLLLCRKIFKIFPHVNGVLLVIL